MANSLDPRVNRLNFQINKHTPGETISEHQHWETYEVFVQPKSGAQPVHEGSLHAADHDMALIFAKEQFARRGDCYNIWVVKTSNVYTLSAGDSDMFDTLSEKKYRNPSGFKVSDKITQYKKEHSSNNPPK